MSVPKEEVRAAVRDDAEFPREVPGLNVADQTVVSASPSDRARRVVACVGAGGKGDRIAGKETTGRIPNLGEAIGAVGVLQFIRKCLKNKFYEKWSN